jgi:hypothetical protein
MHGKISDRFKINELTGRVMASVRQVINLGNFISPHQKGMIFLHRLLLLDILEYHIIFDPSTSIYLIFYRFILFLNKN